MTPGDTTAQPTMSTTTTLTTIPEAGAVIEALLTAEPDVIIAVGEVLRELAAASAKYPPLNSYHEAWAVITEEVDEFWDHVKAKPERRTHFDAARELTQVAAMAVRAIVDLKPPEGGHHL